MKILVPLIFVFLFLSCNSWPTNEFLDNPKKLKGVYKLLSLQSQEDTFFLPMEGVEIIKIITDSQWVSPAYLSKNNKVVNTVGGTYTYKNDEMSETIVYHSKDSASIGLVTNYKIKFLSDTLYQSGIFKKGTSEEWKVEEYWIRVE